jgi:hypothetical protein
MEGWKPQVIEKLFKSNITRILGLSDAIAVAEAAAASL